MKRVNIDHFISLLQKCKEEGCVDLIFEVEPKTINGAEFHLTITQCDKSIIISTKKALN